MRLSANERSSGAVTSATSSSSLPAYRARALSATRYALRVASPFPCATSLPNARKSSRNERAPRRERTHATASSTVRPSSQKGGICASAPRTAAACRSACSLAVGSFILYERVSWSCVTYTGVGSQRLRRS